MHCRTMFSYSAAGAGGFRYLLDAEAVSLEICSPTMVRGRSEAKSGLLLRNFGVAWFDDDAGL